MECLINRFTSIMFGIIFAFFFLNSIPVALIILNAETLYWAQHFLSKKLDKHKMHVNSEKQWNKCILFSALCLFFFDSRRGPLLMQRPKMFFVYILLWFHSVARLELCTFAFDSVMMFTLHVARQAVRSLLLFRLLFWWQYFWEKFTFVWKRKRNIWSVFTCWNLFIFSST